MTATHQKVADMIVELFISSPVHTTDCQVADMIATEFIRRYTDMGATHSTISKMIALQITASSMDATICEIADKIAMHLIIRSAIENAMKLI